MHWHKGNGWDSKDAREARAMPTAKAIQRLSWGVEDRLPKVTAKSEGERVVTRAPLRRVIHRDPVNWHLTKRPLAQR